MSRRFAINAAKQAYRLFITRGLICPGFHVSSKGEGYTVVFPLWVVYLNDNGTLHHATKR